MLVVAPLRRPTSAGASMPPARWRTSAVSDAEGDHGGREQVEAQAVPAQRGQEAGAHLQADRVHEEDEAQLADELAGPLLDVHAEVAERDADEENARDPEAHAADLHAPQREAEGRHEREDEDRSRRRGAVEERRAHAPRPRRGAHSRTSARSQGPRVSRSPAATAFCERSSVPGP